MTLSEALELWIQQKNYSENFVNIVRRRTHNHFAPIMQTSVEKITNKELSELIDKMHEKKLADCTISLLCRELRDLFNFLVEQKIIEKTPYSDDLNPKGKASSFSAFSEEEELLLRNAIPRIPLSRLFQFCLDTGIKSNEARALRTENVHPETNEIDILYTVSRTPETIVPLEVPKKCLVSPSVIDALNIENFSSQLLFPNAKGNLILAGDVHKNGRLLILLTNIPDVTLNHLAKTYCNKRRGIKQNDSNKINDFC